MPDTHVKNLVNEYNERRARLVEHSCWQKLMEPFDPSFDKFVTAANEFNPEDDTNSAWLELARCFSKNVRFDHFPTALAQAANAVGEMLVTIYEEELDNVFKPPSLGAYRQRFALGADMKANQASRIAAIIREHFVVAIERSRDIEMRRTWLSTRFAGFEETLRDSGTDIGNLAHNFGVGALAVTHPLIGIPALVANLKKDSERSKAAGAFIEEYQGKLKEYSTAIEELTSEIVDAANRSGGYASAKFRESVADGIAHILSELERCGLPTGHYHDNLAASMVDIEKLELQYFGEDNDA